MTSFASFAATLLSQAWSAMLVFAAAVAIVLALRLPCRRLFGAGQALQLWSLVPLMLLTAAWPRTPGATASRLPPVVVRIVTAPAVLSAPIAVTASVDWRTLLLAGWAAGVVMMLARAAVTQARFRRQLAGARRVGGESDRWPVWRAARPDVGPALVGLWRPRIIVPANFDTHYSTAEQMLILAHEAMHARRRDIWLSLFALLLASAFWFLPLSGWALVRFRYDQELACDAAVLREHPAGKRQYAQAMLKTQSSRLALPVGCLWSSRHPITERIAMLKQNPPRPLRRLYGLAALVILGLGLGQLVFAAGSGRSVGQPPADDLPAGATADGYTLRLAVSADDRPLQPRSTACYRAGQFYALDEQAAGDLPPWHGRITVVPAEHGQLEVRTDLSGGSLTKPVAPRIRMQPGQPGGIQTGDTVTDKDGRSIDRTLKLEVTAWPGCVKPATAVANNSVQFHFATHSARAVAQSIAQQAGLTIDNPQSLGATQPVAGNFEGVPASEALRLVGNLVGMKPVFNGKQVRFEPQ